MKRNFTYAQELMLTGIDFLKNSSIRRNARYNNCRDDLCFRSLLVYNLRCMDENYFLPLNRDYKPLGLLSGDWVDYKSDLYSHLWIHKDEIDTKVLWSEDGFKDYYLFSDGSSPCVYIKRNTEHLKSFERYEKLIKTSFFGEKLITFEEAWQYKKSIKLLNAWNSNIDRISKIKELEKNGV